MDDAAVLRTHGVECNGPPGVRGALRGAVREPAEELLSLLRSPIRIHDHAGRIGVELQRRLVRKHLERVDRAPITRTQALDCFASDLEDREVPLGALLDLEPTEHHALDGPDQEAPRITQLAANGSLRLADRSGGRGPGLVVFGRSRSRTVATTTAVAVPIAVAIAASVAVAAPVAIPPTVPVSPAAALAITAVPSLSAPAAVAPAAPVAAISAIVGGAASRRYARRRRRRRHDQRAAGQSVDGQHVERRDPQLRGLDAEVSGGLRDRVLARLGDELPGLSLVVVHR
ncbi:MAG: hypothetical protein R3E88_22025 [Myxococcota bacterium]